MQALLPQAPLAPDEREELDEDLQKVQEQAALPGSLCYLLKPLREGALESAVAMALSQRGSKPALAARVA